MLAMNAVSNLFSRVSTLLSRSTRSAGTTHSDTDAAEKSPQVPVPRSAHLAKAAICTTNFDTLARAAAHYADKRSPKAAHPSTQKKGKRLRSRKRASRKRPLAEAPSVAAKRRKHDSDADDDVAKQTRVYVATRGRQRWGTLTLLTPELRRKRWRYYNRTRSRRRMR